MTAQEPYDEDDDEDDPDDSETSLISPAVVAVVSAAAAQDDQKDQDYNDRTHLRDFFGLRAKSSSCFSVIEPATFFASGKPLLSPRLTDKAAPIRRRCFGVLDGISRDQTGS